MHNLLFSFSADLKKTIAVLLEDMMERIDTIERRLDAAQGNVTYPKRQSNYPVGHHIAPRETRAVEAHEDSDSDPPLQAKGQ
jgi:hypothetical protein